MALPSGTCGTCWTPTGLRTQPPSNTCGATQAQNQGPRIPQPRHWPGLDLIIKTYAVGRGHSSLHSPPSGSPAPEQEGVLIWWRPGPATRRVTEEDVCARGRGWLRRQPSDPRWCRGEWLALVQSVLLLGTPTNAEQRGPSCQFLWRAGPGPTCAECGVGGPHGELSCGPKTAMPQTGRVS